MAAAPIITVLRLCGTLAAFEHAGGFLMTSPRWWQSGAVYQIYPRSYQDSNADGVGDLRGILQRLDYLQTLGVGAIWLSPFFKSPMADFGYDVADYCDVDPLFGTLDDFDELVAAAHARDIKVIIDYVPNHTSSQHPWFLESRQSRTNPKADWYIWRDPKPNGGLPNNWGSAFGGPAWTWDEQRGQYYFHQFTPQQPDLNWRNPEVKAAMLDVLRFWFRRGVDGFRMDVIWMIWKHPDMPDQPPLPGAVLRGENDIFNSQQHIYDWDYEGIHDLMREMRLIADEFGDTVLIGEIYLPLERWVRYYGTADAPELHLPFNFRLIELREWTAAAVRSEIAMLEAAVPRHGYPNYVLNNHDQPRFPSRFGAQHTRTAAMLLLTLRGTPTLYQGEEIGMVNGIIAPHQIKDPQGINLGLAHTRDVARTPMQWDSSPYAGFSTVEPWLPVHPDYTITNVAAQINAPHSTFNLYRTLLKLRREHTAFSIGTLTLLDLHPDVVAYERASGTERFIVVLNFGSKPLSVEPPVHGVKVLSTHAFAPNEPIKGHLELWGNEGVIMRVTP
jgi:alpha-glucosidase